MLEKLEARGPLESIAGKFDLLAAGYSDHDYADPAHYLARRVEVVRRLGPPLPPGASVLDLGCGDATAADLLLGCGYRYHGVDASTGMIEAARWRLDERAGLEVGDFEHYEPAEPVDLTLSLRAVIYARNRPAFFRRVARYTRTKFVFDFNPRVQSRREIERELRDAGFSQLDFRPFFLPQLVAVGAPLRASLRCLESVPPLARVALRVRGIWFCAASGAGT